MMPLMLKNMKTTVKMIPLMVTLMQTFLGLKMPEPIMPVQIIMMMILAQLTLMMVMLVPIIILTLRYRCSS